ncbi:unnamed protein product, partial [Rotaria sp. Silwood1]
MALAAFPTSSLAFPFKCRGTAFSSALWSSSPTA